MNKLTKQLLSLGLSVVTVAGMVSPVFADDDVNPVNDTTDVVEQETTNNEQQPQAAVPGQSEGSQVDTSEGGTTSDDQTVMKTYNLKIVYQYENREETTTFTIPESENVSDYIMNHYCTEGYNSRTCYQDGSGIWILNVAKLTYVKVKQIKDGIEDDSLYSTSVPAVYNDEQIKEYLSRNIYAKYDLKSIEKQSDGVWVIDMVKANPDNETFKLIINKDGQETTSTITVSKEEQKKYRFLDNYLIKNYLPDGYHIDRGLGKGIYAIGTDTWKMYIVKDNENPVLKTYVLKLTLAGEFGQDNTFDDAKVEYHTFEYDSTSTDGIYDYISKKFIPKGYETQWGASSGELVSQRINITVYKLNPYETRDDGDIYYQLSYVDRDTNKTVLNYSTGLLGERKTVITTKDLTEIPNGYVFDGNSFAVTEEDGQLKSTIYVKKGEYKVPVTIGFYEEENDKLVNIKTINEKAQDIDANKDGTLDVDEIKQFIPEGYKFDKWLYENNVYTSYDGYYTSRSMSVCIKKTDSTIISSSSEESKNIATIENEDLKTILNDSLSEEQKEKVNDAIDNNKTVEFVPVLKESVKSEDKKVLEDYAQKNDVNVVNAFDIEIQLYIDNEQVGTIPVTNKELVFKVSIPNELKKSGRQFYILRLHDGKVDKIPVNEDGTFTTNKFSSYMLVYEDVSSSSKPAEGTKDDNKTPSTPEKTNPSTETKDTSASKAEETKNTTNTSSKSNKSTSTKKGVNTGVKTQSTLFAGLAVISVASIGLVEVLKRRK